jgi:hypothetical protein
MISKIVPSRGFLQSNEPHRQNRRDRTTVPSARLLTPCIYRRSLHSPRGAVRPRRLALSPLLALARSIPGLLPGADMTARILARLFDGLFDVRLCEIQRDTPPAATRHSARAPSGAERRDGYGAAAATNVPLRPRRCGGPSSRKSAMPLECLQPASRPTCHRR